MRKSMKLALCSFGLAVLALIAAFKGTLTPGLNANASQMAHRYESDIIAHESEQEEFAGSNSEPGQEQNFIKWIDLNFDGKILKSVLKLCKDYRTAGIKPAPEFHEVLAYLATKNGNRFSSRADETALKRLRKHLDEGGTVGDIYGENKYYRYYVESYRAVFDGMIGEFRRPDSTTPEYGIKGFFPIANGFWFNHYDDFGNSRTYGFKRRHLGHDMMGAVGTPIIAVEEGTVTELGWNRFGGWRIGIRSFDQKRYYYYAHLRKDKPFATGLKLGDTITAGQVIGFLGHTGYSTTENVNLKSGSPHLHIGLQIIFDKSQEKGAGEIWVDLYGITNFLSSERVRVIKNPETKEWNSTSFKHSVE